MKIFVTPTFERVVKKLHKAQKQELDEAVRAIAIQPESGEFKVGDLSGVRMLKFRMGDQVCLLAYRQCGEDNLKLLAAGPHENFYRDLRRVEH